MFLWLVRWNYIVFSSPSLKPLVQDVICPALVNVFWNRGLPNQDHSVVGSSVKLILLIGVTCLLQFGYKLGMRVHSYVHFRVLFLGQGWFWVVGDVCRSIHQCCSIKTKGWHSSWMFSGQRSVLWRTSSVPLRGSKPPMTTLSWQSTGGGIRWSPTKFSFCPYSSWRKIKQLWEPFYLLYVCAITCVT